MLVLYDSEDFLEEDYDVAETMWSDFHDELIQKFGWHKCVAVGSNGLWDGRHDAGFCGNIQDFLSGALQDMDFYKFFVNDNEEFFFQGIHHDGRNEYHIKVLTNEGEYFFQENEDEMSPRELHKQLLEKYSEEIQWKF